MPNTALGLLVLLVCKHEYKYFEDYHSEMEYIVQHEKRNNLIKNLVKDIEGNTLVLFNYVEKHGEPLFELINNNVSDREIFFVHGGTDVEDREEVRKLTETQDNAIIIASYGTFSTGINIKRLHNIIFASPSKSRVRNLQSIGRVLRKGDGKDIATLYDIAEVSRVRINVDLDTTVDSTNGEVTSVINSTDGRTTSACET
jgi:superfamily II DNA or RNA helicase